MDRNLPPTQPGSKLRVRDHHSYTSQRTDSDWKPVQDGSTGFTGLTSAAWEGGAELRPSFLPPLPLASAVSDVQPGVSGFLC